MRVAIFCPYDFSYPGGVQTQAIDLAYSLNKKGHDIFLFAPLSGKNIHEILGIQFFDIGKPTSVNFLGSKSRISFNIFKILGVIKLIKKYKVEIIHLNEPLSPIFLPLIYLLRKFRIVGTFHAYGEKKHFWYKNFKWFLSYFLSKIDYKICVSPSSQTYINQYFDFESKIVPNGILLSKFKEKNFIPKALRNSNKKILFIGRFEEKRKGFNILLSAFNKLSKEIENLELIVAGSGNFKNIQLINKKVSFLGPVKQEDLSSYYNNVDLICLPSVENESFGVIILESMASGKVLVLSDINSYKELSNKNDYGFLYDHSSSKELYSLLSNLLNKKISTEKNIKNGLKNVRNYSWDYLVSEIIKIYTKLIN